MKIISVIIPTYNRIKMLLKCINSIFSQTYKNIEIIIVDDASTDETQETVSNKFKNEPRIKYIRNNIPNGPGKARHQGYLASTGDYIVYCDSDDYYTNNRFFETAISIFDKYPPPPPDFAFVAANAVVFDTVTKYKTFRPLNINGYVKKENYLVGFTVTHDKPLSTFTAVFSKDILELAGFSTMEMMNDHSIYLRALCYGDAYILDDIAGVYVRHESNISKALPHQFLLDNLEEKKRIYKIAQKRFAVPLNKWFKQQIFNSVYYYFKHTKCSRSQKKEVIIWCKNNKCDIRMKLLTAFLFHALRK